MAVTCPVMEICMSSYRLDHLKLVSVSVAGGQDVFVIGRTLEALFLPWRPCEIGDRTNVETSRSIGNYLTPSRPQRIDAFQDFHRPRRSGFLCLSRHRFQGDVRGPPLVMKRLTHARGSPAPPERRDRKAWGADHNPIRRMPITIKSCPRPWCYRWRVALEVLCGAFAAHM